MSILLLAEHENAELRVSTLNALAAAQRIGGDVHVLVAGHECGPAAEAAAKLPDVAKVLLADDEVYAHRTAEPLTALVVKLAGDYDYIIAPHTTSARNVLPRAAALLDVAPISDITGVESADTFVRPIYAGNAIATVQSTDSLKIITVRTTSFEETAWEGGDAEIEKIEAAEDPELSSFVGEELTESERPELTTARIVISGGRGLGSAENFKLLEELADRLGAAVGASRAAVDAGYVPNDYQVGQTGKVVAPDLYMAVGISGAIQHLAGMKDSKVIVAINKDEEAPIFQVADYGLVGDLFKVVPELQAEIEKGD